VTTPTTLPVIGGATPLREHPRRAFVEQVMGLPVSVLVRGPQAREPGTARAVAALFERLRADDAVFSTWRPDSAVSRIQLGELRVEDAGTRVQEVAYLCREAERQTQGAFSAWVNGVFDPTGLVKGWAVEQATLELERRLARHDLLVNAGGDILATCRRIDTPDWRIAVEDPRDRTRTLLTVPLRRGAVATSGTAARGEHIIDPATGTPARGLLSATVIGPSLCWADVHATAAFVRGPGRAPMHASDDYVTVLVDRAGEMTISPPPAGRIAQ
jgi:thiamine biosynthesis lipoprotein